MTKKLSLLLMLVFAYAGISFGQTVSASSNGTAHITVSKALYATNLSSKGNGLDFGTVPEGQSNTITTKQDSAAAFQFKGESGDQVYVSVPSSITMTATNNHGAPLTVTNIQATYNSKNQQGNAAQANVDHGKFAANLDESTGELYMWIGGSVSVPTNQKAGDYQGTFNVSISYTND